MADSPLLKGKVEDLKRRSLGRSVSHLHSHIRVYLQRELEEYGIGSGQYAYLMLLYRYDGSSQDELTEKLRVDKATTTRAIVKLVRTGFVRRMRDTDDRRKFHVFLTKKGWEFRPVLREILDRWTEGLLEGFTEEERESIFILLERLESNAEGMS